MAVRVRTLIIFSLLLLPVSLLAQPTIDNIEINQAIGIQKNGALKFVAGKDAVIRAFLAKSVTVDETSTRATIVRDGKHIATIPPLTPGEKTNVVDFLCPTRATCDHWAAGDYEFEVTVNGSTKSTRGTTYAFVERAEMRILAVPVTANYAGTVVPLTDDKWKTFADYVRAVYPVAADKLIWVTREEIDLSGPEFDLETEKGQDAVWKALAKLVPPSCAGNPHEDGCYTQVFGFIQARPEVYPNGELQGFTNGMPANIGVATDDDAPGTVAHEIGHTYLLGDTYDGGGFNCDVNPAPDNFRGTKLELEAPPEPHEPEEVVCTAGRVQLHGVSGTKIPASHHPYEVGGRGALGDSAEFMGSRGKQVNFWVSQDIYDHLFDQFAPKSSAAALAPKQAPKRYVQCFGSIHRKASSADGVRVDPCWTFFDADPIPSTSGPYMLVAVDAAGNRLATTAIDPEFDPVGPKGRPQKHREWGAFRGDVAFPGETVKLQIVHGEMVLRELPVSPHAPRVTNVAPEAKGRMNRKRAITWEANDADNAALTYQVDYNANVRNPYSEWQVLRSDLTEKRFVVDFGKLAGGPHARIRVLATDGVLTASAESVDFEVPAKAPQVTIEELPNGGVYTFGEEVILDGDAADLQDDDVKESELRWTLNRRAVGSGTPLVLADLPVGEHTVTLSVTNSLGVRGSATRTLRVVPKP